MAAASSGAADDIRLHDGRRSRSVLSRLTCAGAVLLTAAGLGAGGYYLYTQATKDEAAACTAASFTVVQSIPVERFDVQPIAASIPTHEAFVRCAKAIASQRPRLLLIVCRAGCDPLRTCLQPRSIGDRVARLHGHVH